jgi:hypothetical protein
VQNPSGVEESELAYGRERFAFRGAILKPNGAQLLNPMLKTLTSPVVTALLVAGCLTLAACSASGRTQVDVAYDVPFGPDIEVKYDSNPAPAGTGTVTGLPPGKCLKTTYTDSDGNELPDSPVWTPVDGTGTTSGPIPEGAVRYQSSVEDCPPEPEPEPNDVDDETPVPPPTGGSGGSGGMFDPLQTGQAGGRTVLPTFHFFGGTIAPDDTIGAENLSYALSVRATSHAAAEAIASQIIDTGIGAIVPSNVIITRYSLTIPTLAGARIITASPDGIDEFSFDLNQGTFFADLATSTNVLTYAQGTWDVVETVAPLSAFNNSILPGASYENHADFSWSTTRFHGTSTGQLTLSAVND